MDVRSATFADREILARLLAAQLAEHGISLDAPLLAAAIDGVIERPERGRFLIARASGEDVGVAYVSFLWALEHGGKSAWLEELYVVPAQRSAGFGTTLLRAACALARDEGCAAMDLEVEADHARAARLYEREGFRAHRRARWVKVLEH
jgi:GNAT superfamily N-acetyltransferase